MSLEVTDVRSDEEQVNETFRFSEDFLERKTGLKKTPKPPSSPKSPYLTSLNVNPHRAAVAAWRLPRASLGGSREGTPGEKYAGPLSNTHGLSPMIRAECAVSPPPLKKHFRKEQRLLLSAANVWDMRNKEDMYAEILHLKKRVHEHKSDNRQMKTKLRRLEEENIKRERQIEELLDPTTGVDFARNMVDNKRGASVVVNGLKQRILKLEQQCRDKERALSKLQSELRPTNLEELKRTVGKSFEEIQRLKMRLDASERQSTAENKSWQRQRRTLNSEVQHLTERANFLQQENQRLAEELNTEPPTAGPSGYMEWSKKRLVRRVLELQKRLGDKKRPAPSEKTAALLDQKVQTVASEMPVDTQPFTVATEAGSSMATMTEEGEQEPERTGCISQWEQERAELQETLRKTEDELAQLKTEKESCEKELEGWKAQQSSEWEKEKQLHKDELAQLKTEKERREKELEEWKAQQSSEWENERQQHKLEMEVLWTKLQTLEEEREQAALSALEKLQDKTERLSMDSGLQQVQGAPEMDAWRRQRAAQVIQRYWRIHRDRDVVLLQSALRGHLHRDVLLKAAERTQRGDEDLQTTGLLNLKNLILIQSALRGHLTRSGKAPLSSGLCASSRVGSSLASPGQQVSPQIRDGENSKKHIVNQMNEDTIYTGHTVSSRPPNLHKDDAEACDSDNSDDIIVSPSRPIRRKESDHRALTQDDGSFDDFN